MNNLMLIDRLPRKLPPLHESCREGDLKREKLLLSEGAEVNQAARYGVTPLYVSCFYGRLESARLLLSEGAAVNQTAQYCVSPLYISCCRGHLKCARLLLSEGAAVNRAAQFGLTPLLASCCKGHLECARLLLSEGAAVNEARNDGMTPLIASCFLGNAEMARLLLSEGAAVDQATHVGLTPLYVSCFYGRLECAMLMLLEGAAVNQTNSFGLPPVYISFTKGHLECAALMLAAGASLGPASLPMLTARKLTEAWAHAERKVALLVRSSWAARGAEYGREGQQLILTTACGCARAPRLAERLRAVFNGASVTLRMEGALVGADLPASRLGWLARLSTLESLHLPANQLRELPVAISELSALRMLDVSRNELVELPTWLVQMASLRALVAHTNPLQFPPASAAMGTNCYEAVRRHLLIRCAQGSTTSRRVKIVFVGAALSGKTSTMRGIRHGAPTPTAECERTVQLELHTLHFGQVVGSAWDFGGDRPYAAAQQMYLVGGALYVLCVAAHTCNDASYEEALGRWLDALQARAPGAVVQLVLTHADRLVRQQRKRATLLAHLTTRGRKKSCFSPKALAYAAAEPLAWLRARLAAHRDAVVAADPLAAPLRVQQAIPCVCAAEGGTESLRLLRTQLEALVHAEPPLLPSVNLRIPLSWLPALALPRALRDGHAPFAVAVRALEDARLSVQPSAADEVSAASEPLPRLSTPRPYVQLEELRAEWRQLASTLEVAAALGQAPDPLLAAYDSEDGVSGLTTLLDDALELLVKQGEIFMLSDLVFLDPAFVTELIKPLVDHQLSLEREARLLRDRIAHLAADCAVCLEPLGTGAVVSLGCSGNHRFHLHCATGWFGSQRRLGRQPRCPLCTAPVEPSLVQSLLSRAAQGGAAGSSEEGSSEEGTSAASQLDEWATQLDQASLEHMVRSLVEGAELRERALPFFWRKLSLPRHDLGRMVRMLSESRLLVEKPPVRLDDGALERRWLVPMRLPEAPPPSAQDVWPPYQLREDEAQLSVLLEMLPARVPPGVLEQCVALCLGGEQRGVAWRGGMLLEHSIGEGLAPGIRLRLFLARGESVAACAGPPTKLMVEARGEVALDQLMGRLGGLFSVVRRVLGEFTGLRYTTELTCPRCLREGRWSSPRRWNVDTEPAAGEVYCEKCEAFVQLPLLAREMEARTTRSAAPNGRRPVRLALSCRGGVDGEFAARLSKGLAAGGEGVEVMVVEGKEEERVDQIVRADVYVPLLSKTALAPYAALTTRSGSDVLLLEHSLGLDLEARRELRFICPLLVAEAAAPEEAEPVALTGARPRDSPDDTRVQSSASWSACCPDVVVEATEASLEGQLVRLGKGRPQLPTAERCVSRVLTSLLEHAHVRCADRSDAAAERAVEQLAKVARAVRLGVQAALA